MIIDELLSRADDETLQKLIGKSALRLIGALDPHLLAPEKLREVLIDLRSRETLLSSQEDRSMLFDLLPVSDAKRLARLFNIVDDESLYRALRSLRISKGSQREELLFAFFNLDIPRSEPIEDTPSMQEENPGYGLFRHQRHAARNVQQLLLIPPRRVLLHMPTGSGKTRTAMNIAAEHLREHEPGLVVWLAYSEELCEQAAKEFERSWHHLGNRPIKVNRFWGGRNLDLGEGHDGIVVAGLGKLFSAAKKHIPFIGELSSKTTLVIIDEAHQSIAETYRLVIESLLALNPQTGLLGLTATPGRTYSDVDADEELAKFFGKQKVMLQVDGYENPVAYLVENGYLAKTNFSPLFLENGLDLTPTDLSNLKESLDISDDLLQRLAEDEQRNLGIVYRIEEMAKKHNRIIVFATTVSHSNLLATVLRARGWNASSITSQTQSTDRNRIIDSFKASSSESMILCNYGVLTTGFDAPRTSAALIARPTKSLVLYSQMVGRAIRGVRAGGNDEAEVVTVIDTNLPGFRDVAEAFTNWEDVWN